MRKMIVHDSETYPNYHCHVFYDVAVDHYHVFVICNQLGRDDTDKLRDFIIYNREKAFFIGYNNLSYDFPLLEYSIQNNRTNAELKRFSDSLIWNGGYTEDDSNVIDLYKIMHFDNKAKAVSLKWLSCVMNSPSIEDLPYSPSRVLSVNEMIQLTEYCKNDVRITYQFFNEVKDKVKFHFQAKLLYKVPSHNYNEVKIGEHISRVLYTSDGAKVVSPPTPPKSIDLKHVILYRPSTDFVKRLVDNLNKVSLSADFKENGKEFERKLLIDDKVYTVASGGLHSEDHAMHYISDDEYLLLDRDVASEYPNAIANFRIYPSHLGPKWAEDTRDTISERFLHKKGMKDKSKTVKEKTEHALKSDLLKLSLNGGKYGKLNSEYSWQYDPVAMLKVTINCQLCLLDLVVDATEAGIKVLSANTDGVLVYIKRSMLPVYDDICDRWMKRTKFILEDTEYEEYYAKDVNNYLAIISRDKNYIKTKGVFEVEKKIGKQTAYHKNFSAKIVAIALKEHIVNKIPIEQTIRNHTEPMDFMIHARAKKTQKNGASSFVFRTFDKAKQLIVDLPIGKIVRYYCSKRGGKIMKTFDNGKETDLNVGSYHTLHMTHNNEDISKFDINYIYYIQLAEKCLQADLKTTEIWT